MQIGDSTEDDAELSSIQDRMIDTVTLRQQEAIESVEIAGQAVAVGVGLAHREVVGYLAQRLRVDIEAQQALFRCRNFEEVCALQGRYMREVMEQFGDEMARLLRLGKEIAARSVERAHI